MAPVTSEPANAPPSPVAACAEVVAEEECDSTAELHDTNLSIVVTNLYTLHTYLIQDTPGQLYPLAR